MIHKLLLLIGVFLFAGFTSQAQQLNMVPTQSGSCTGQVILENSTQYNSWNWLVNNQAVSETNDTISNLCYGSTVTVVVNGIDTTSIFVDTIPTSPCTNFLATLAQTQNASDEFTCDAVVVSTVQGGTAPYTYEWNNSTTNATNTQACPGNVVLIVSDANGCEYTTQLMALSDTSLCDNFLINASTTNTSDDISCDGTGTAFINAGTAPYIFDWGVGSGTNTIQGLCYGTGVLTITDANGCTATTSYFVDSNTICTGFQVALAQGANATSPVSCDGVIYSTVQGGTMPFTYEWNNSTTNASNLQACAGNATLIVTDANGCETLASIYVQASNICDSLQASLSSTPTSTISECDGSASGFADGGLAPYTYFWSFITGNSQTVQNPSNLCYGSGTLIVTDANGCMDTLYFHTDTLSNSNSISASVYVTPESYTGACDGIATVYPYGGVSPFTYSHSNGATTQTATGLCAGIYSVVITDVNGNSYSLQYLISSPSNSSSGNGGYSGTPIDTLYSALVENCNIDYTTIDTMYASSFAQFGSDSLVVTWAIIQGTDTSYMTYTYDLSNTNPTGTGLTNVVLTIYCPFRGLGEYWMVSDNINLENETSGISENEIDEINVYQQFDDLSVWVILPNETHFTACLYDVTGKRIFEKSLFGQKEKINLDNVSKGKYVLTIQTEKLFKSTLISK